MTYGVEVSAEKSKIVTNSTNNISAHCLHGLGMSHTMAASPKPFFMTPWSAEKMLDGQLQKVDIPAHAKLLTRASCGKDWKRISAESSLMSPWHPNQSREWTELNKCPIFKNSSSPSHHQAPVTNSHIPPRFLCVYCRIPAKGKLIAWFMISSPICFLYLFVCLFLSCFLFLFLGEWIFFSYLYWFCTD